jgi:tetratricopeptide (TPR) repeat protein
MNSVRNMNRHLSLGAAALALLFGCATTTTSTHGKVADDGLGPSSRAAEAPTDVFKATPKQAEPKVSDDQRADFDKAVAVYQKLKKNGSLKGSDCDEAASAFRRIADEYPTMLIARHNEASVYMECGRKQEAARLEEDLARKNYAPALANLGYAASINGDSAQAESYFNRSVEADPLAGSVAARINLAQILRDKGRRASAGDRERYIKDALTHLRKVLAVDGNNLQAYATMCFIYFDLGLPDAAILIGTQAIKKADEIATGKFEDESVGDIVNRDKAAKGKKGKREEKSEDGPKSAKEIVGHGTGWTTDMKKNVAVVHNTLGLVALNKKSYKDAIPSFKKAVDLDPELYEARLNLAAVSLRFRDYVTAEEQFKAVVSAQPRNYEAVIGLGVAQRGARKYDEAEQQYLAAQRVDPSRADSYFNLGLLYQEYKGSERPTLEKAQQFYREFLSRANGSSSSGTKMRRDAEKRIKDIDELFVALAEAAKLQREAEEIQRKAEEQQKKMEEEMKRQDDADKKKGVTPPAETPAPSSPTTPPPATSAPSAPPASATAPPPAGGSSVPTLN